MTGIVLEKKGKHCIVIDAQSGMHRIRNENAQIGDEIALPIERPVQRVWYIRAGGVAASVATIAAVFLIGLYIRMPVMTMYIDINPSVQVSLNRLQYVVSSQALNEDGEALLDGLHMQGKKLERALTLLADEAEAQQYFEGNATMLLTVVSEDEAKASRTADEAADVLARHFTAKQHVTVEAGSAAQSVVEQAAAQGTTPGKLMLVDRMLEADKSLDRDTLLQTEVRDLVAALNTQRESAQVEDVIPDATPAVYTTQPTTQPTTPPTPVPTLAPVPTTTALPTSEPSAQPTPSSAPVSAQPTPAPTPQFVDVRKAPPKQVVNQAEPSPAPVTQKRSDGISLMEFITSLVKGEPTPSPQATPNENGDVSSGGTQVNESSDQDEKEKANSGAAIVKKAAAEKKTELNTEDEEQEIEDSEDSGDSGNNGNNGNGNGNNGNNGNGNNGNGNSGNNGNNGNGNSGNSGNDGNSGDNGNNGNGNSGNSGNSGDNGNNGNGADNGNSNGKDKTE